MTYRNANELYQLGCDVADKAVRKGLWQYDNAPKLRESGQRVKYKAQLERETEDLPNLYASFFVPGPDTWGKIIHDFANVASALSNPPTPTDNGSHIIRFPRPINGNSFKPILPAAQLLSEFYHHVDDWGGTAKENFFTNFVSGLPIAISQQGWLGAALLAVLQHQEGVQRAANSDIWMIGQKTLKALDSLPSMWFFGFGAADVSVILSIVGSLAGFLESDGVTAAAVVGAASSADGLVNSTLTKMHDLLAPTGHSDGKIGGSSVEDVLGDMRDTITKLVGVISHRDASVASVLKDINGYIQSHQQQFSIPAPSSIMGLEHYKSASALRGQFEPRS